MMNVASARRVGRRVLIFMAVPALVLSCWACGEDSARASLVGFSAAPDSRSLLLVVERGPNDTITEGRVLNQDDASVTVEVLMRRAEGEQPAQAVRDVVTVELEAPLGGRQVQAASGQPIPRTSPGS
jgi:hypothetical protein